MGEIAKAVLKNAKDKAAKGIKPTLKPQFQKKKKPENKSR